MKVWAVGSAGRADDLDPTPATWSWMVDTVAPAGTVKINKGATRTKKLSVVLNLAATDTALASGVSKMRFSHDGKTWTAWQAYEATKTWALKRGTAGPRTVFAQFADKAGNPSVAVKDTIRYRL